MRAGVEHNKKETAMVTSPLQDALYRMTTIANGYKTSLQKIQEVLADKNSDHTFRKLSQVEAITKHALKTETPR